MKTRNTAKDLNFGSLLYPSKIALKFYTTLLVFFLVCIGFQERSDAQTDMLDDAQFSSLDFLVGDAVYDPNRGVVYATVPSSQGIELGNRLVTIEPSSGLVIASVFVGSEPNQVAVSDDGSRVYIGIDGSQGVRYYEPETGELGPIFTLGAGPAVAEDLAVAPGVPNAVVVSRDQTGNSADGNLEVFTDEGSTFSQSFFVSCANLIGFIDNDTLFGFNNSNTGFGGTLYDFNGETLTQTQSQRSLISVFNVEVEVSRDGLLNFTNGLVIDPTTLLAKGTFNINLDTIDSTVESVPESGLTYFAGPASFFTNVATLRVFCSETFLQLDSIEMTGITIEDGRGELITAGEGRLALISDPDFSDGFSNARRLTFISNIPVSDGSGPLLGDVDLSGDVNFSDIGPFIEVLITAEFMTEADCNEDGAVDFFDIGVFIGILNGCSG